MGSVMVTRKGINIFGHYVVSMNDICLFHIQCTYFYTKKIKGRTESYFILFSNSMTIRHGVLILGYYVKFIPTAVSSN